MNAWTFVTVPELLQMGLFRVVSTVWEALNPKLHTANLKAAKPLPLALHPCASEALLKAPEYVKSHIHAIKAIDRFLCPLVLQEPRFPSSAIIGVPFSLLIGFYIREPKMKKDNRVLLGNLGTDCKDDLGSPGLPSSSSFPPAPGSLPDSESLRSSPPPSDAP